MLALLLCALPGRAFAQLYVGVSGDNVVNEYRPTDGSILKTGFITALTNPGGVAISGSSIYVASFDTGVVGKYLASSGAAINANFITGLTNPSSVTVAGNALYVTNFGNGTVGKYNATTGAVIDANFITGLSQPSAALVNGNNLYVANQGTGIIGFYNATTGAVFTANFVTGLNLPEALAVSGNSLLVATHDNVVSQYDASLGTTINANFITGLNGPHGLAIAGDTLYVSNFARGSVDKFDVNTGAAVQTNLIAGLNNPTGLAVLPSTSPGGLPDIEVGTNPTALVVNPVTNLTYVANQDSDDISVIDGASSQVVDTLTTGFTGSAPLALVFNEVTQQLYVANADPSFGALVAIDVKTRLPTVVGGVPPASAVAVNPVTGVTYALSTGTNELVAVSRTFAVTSVNVGATPTSLAVNAATNTVYVGTSSLGVAVVDGATLAVVHTASTDQMGAIAVNSVTNLIYALDQSTGGVQVLDGATTNILATVPIGPATTLALNAVTNEIYVSNITGTKVRVIDGLTRAVRLVDVGQPTSAVAVNSSTNKIYFASPGTPIVEVLDGNTNQVDTLSTSAGAGAIGINPITNRIYVTIPTAGKVSVLDGDTFQPIGIDVPGSHQFAAVDPATNRIYLTGGPTTYALDLQMQQVLTVGNGLPALDAVYDPAARKLYTISLNRKELRQLDVQTGAVATAPLSNLPYALALDPALGRVYVAMHATTVPITTVLAAFDGLVQINSVALTATSDFRFVVNPATHKIYALGFGGVWVRLDEALNESEHTASAPVALSFTNGSGPYLAVNPVTNKIYMLLYGDGVAPGRVLVINGALDQEEALMDVGVGPVSVAVSSTTNLIYVANSISGSVTSIDGVTNATGGGILGGSPQPVAVAVDPAGDRVYVASPTGQVDVIEGDVYVRSLTGLGRPVGVLVNPATGKIYLLDQVANKVIQIDPAPAAPSNLAAFISPLPNNTVSEPFASCTLSGVRAFRSDPVPASALFYQLDSKLGPWTKAVSFGGPATAFVNNLSFGYHTLYAFATDAAGVGSDAVGSVAGAPISRVVAYTFLYRPGSFSFADPAPQAPASGRSVTLTVQRDFTDDATVDYETLDGSALAGINYTPVQGTLSFTGGATARTITVPILDRSLGTPSLAFSVRLFAQTGGSRIAAPGVATVTVLDDQSAAMAVVIPQPTQTAPQAPPNATASITVNLDPPEANGQWRLFGERAWRDSRTAASGLVAASYSVEYKLVSGYTQPQTEVVTVMDGEAAVRGRMYGGIGPAQSGLLTVTLSPAAGQWRLEGGAFQPSGGAPISLNVGSYLIEYQPLAGRATPPPQVIAITEDHLTAVTATYLIADALTGAVPVLVDDAVARTTSPYEFVGQIQTDQGLGTGFVPFTRTVATAAHVLFEDGSLSYVTGVRWFFQHEFNVFEAPPQIPRGTYLFSGYSTQRTIDASPGISTAASQQLDAAAMYFLEPAGRGGSSGILGSNSAANPWLLSHLLKRITGYPVDVVGTPGRLFATPPVTDPLSYVSGALYKTTALTSYAGNSGGPLCVLFTDGNYYPAGIYLGGTAQTVVRAIDSRLVDLLQRAEATGEGGAIKTGNGIAHLALGLSGNTALTLGSVRADLSPAGAVAAGAGWRLDSDASSRASGQAALGFLPGDYPVTFTAVPGYTTPAATTAHVIAGEEAVVTGDYVLASVPDITSPLLAQAVVGQSFRYQIVATVSPDGFTATPLPPGFHFDPSTGLLTGLASPAALAGSPYTIKLSAHNALGDSVERSLALTISAAGQLQVSVSGAGTVPQAFRRTTVRPVGAVVSIQATPTATSLFESWRNAATGAVLSTSALYQFTMPPQLSLQAVFVANPFLTGQGTYLALLPGDTFDLAGLLKVSVMRTGSFTAAAQIGGSTGSVVNRFDNHGHYEGTFVLVNGRLFRLTLDLGTPAGTLAGTATDAATGEQIPLLAIRTSTKAPKSLVGAYTAQFPLTTADPALPGGTGYCRFSILANGGVMLSGALGDGKPFTAASQLDLDNTWPLFLLPTGGGQVVSGVLSPSTSAKPTYSGSASWLRAPSANGPFADGFAAPVTFTSSRFTAPAIRYTNATLTFSNGDLQAPLPLSVLFNTKGQTPTGASPSVKLTLSTGLFTGTFLDGTVTRNFQGVVLQETNSGAGLFSAVDGQTGAVLLQKQ